MTDNDREQRLQSLARQNALWAEMEKNLIETIRENKRQLERLPEIIRRLNEQLETATAEMNRTGIEHDVLEAEIKTDEEFMKFALNSRARELSAIAVGTGTKVPFYSASELAAFHEWADEQADDYADHRATEIDKDFMDWANAQDAELIDWRETTRRPNY